MWPILVLVVLLTPLLVVLGLVWSAIRYTRHDPRADASRFPVVRTAEDCDILAADLLQKMSLREKVDQLSGDLPMARFGFRYFVGWKLGPGVPLIYSGLNRRLGIPPLAFSDGPRGVNVGKNKTCFPVTMARGATFDPALEALVGEAIGRETRASGANYSGAVCVNLLRHPGWGRAQETYGEDPFHMGEMGVALTRGIQSQNVMACVKHFALNSIENARFYVDVETDERTLREVYLPHFKKIVQEGQVASVMSAYNQFRGEYCGHNRHLLTRILRKEWGFRGFVTSDWMHGVRDGIAGVKAGMDVEMPARVHYGRPLLQAVARGEVTEEEIYDRAHCVLRTRLWYALKPDPQTYEPDVVACEEHVALARRVAEESMVLLKNDGVLPLDPQRVRRLGVFGRLAGLENTGDHGSSAVHAPYVVTALEGLNQAMGRYGGRVETASGSEEAVTALASSVDAAVVVVGLTHDDEGEWFVLNPTKKADAYRPKFFGGGGDRTNLGLHPEDVALIERVTAAQKTTVVVCVAGSAVTMPWIEQAPAILFAFYSGMEGGNALASIVFGDVNPSGKLPFTIPESSSDCPPFEPFGDKANYGPLHGYTLYETQSVPVSYPFGHGMSYTDFDLQDLEVDTTEEDWRVAVMLTNRGSVAGAEVVQVYVEFPESLEHLPGKRLAAFQKMHLEPGQSEKVCLKLSLQARKVYAPGPGWYTPKVTTLISVGVSSAAIILRKSVN